MKPKRPQNPDIKCSPFLLPNGVKIFDYAERYGQRFANLADSRATEREFEFDHLSS